METWSCKTSKRCRQVRKVVRHSHLFSYSFRPFVVSVCLCILCPAIVSIFLLWFVIHA